MSDLLDVAALSRLADLNHGLRAVHVCKVAALGHDGMGVALADDLRAVCGMEIVLLTMYVPESTNRTLP